MIIFDGYLTGAAKKHHAKRTKNMYSLYGVFCAVFILVVFSPISYVWQNGFNYKFYMLCLPILVSFPLLVRFSYLKGDVLKKVIISEEAITAVWDKDRQSTPLTKVKEIRDYGEYYEVVTPHLFGSIIYVCQKDLLTQGTIADFEAKFTGKIKSILQ